MNTSITSQELKGFQSQLAKAKADAEVLKVAAADAQRKYTQSLNQIKALEERIAELLNGTASPVVSEHAVLRWLERVNGLDIEQVKQVILDNGTADMIMFMKSGSLKKDGHTLVIKNNVVVTVK